MASTGLRLAGKLSIHRQIFKVRSLPKPCPSSHLRFRLDNSFVKAQPGHEVHDGQT
jgi:hypothetical protein